MNCIDRIWTPSDLSQSVVPLSELRLHLRMDGADEDQLIDEIARAATAAVEAYTQRLLVRRSAVLLLSGLPSAKTPIRLPGGQVSAVNAVTVDGVALTGCTAVGQSPAMLIPATDWPVVEGSGYPVSISYTVGYLTCPPDLRAAVKLLASELFERRSNGSGEAIREVPLSAQWLMNQHRIMPQ